MRNSSIVSFMSIISKFTYVSVRGEYASKWEKILNELGYVRIPKFSTPKYGAEIVSPGKIVEVRDANLTPSQIRTLLMGVKYPRKKTYSGFIKVTSNGCHYVTVESRYILRWRYVLSSLGYIERALNDAQMYPVEIMDMRDPLVVDGETLVEGRTDFLPLTTGRLPYSEIASLLRADLS